MRLRADGLRVVRSASIRKPTCDGTVRWAEVARDGVLREASGAAKFALALFLKEVAVVAATGDRTRIEEFFDYVGSTDFYKQYGLFVAGARVGELAYTKFLQRYIKPSFVNGVLKTNMILAAGIALPMIVEGRFKTSTFLLSVGSLGLSSAAVRTGVAGIKWVVDLKKAKSAGLVGTVGAGAGRLARLGGWFYQVAELAVILYLADEIETRVGEYLDMRAAKAAMAEASAELVNTTSDPSRSHAVGPRRSRPPRQRAPRRSPPPSRPPATFSRRSRPPNPRPPSPSRRPTRPRRAPSRKRPSPPRNHRAARPRRQRNRRDRSRRRTPDRETTAAGWRAIARAASRPRRLAQSPSLEPRSRRRETQAQAEPRRRRPSRNQRRRPSPRRRRTVVGRPMPMPTAVKGGVRPRRRGVMPAA